MPRGNPSPKLAITVDPEVRDAVVAAAAAQGVSVSAWMTASARRTLRLADGIRIMDEWIDELGGFTEEEWAASRRELEADRAALPVPPGRRRRSA